MGKKRNHGKSNQNFSMKTITSDGSCVNDIVKWKDNVRSRRSHEAIMRKVERNKAKFSC